MFPTMHTIEISSKIATKTHSMLADSWAVNVTYLGPDYFLKREMKVVIFLSALF